MAPGAWRNLALATLSFALSFAAWGLISAFAPTFRSDFQLTAQQTALLVAVPVLLGSLARLPLGPLTDRFGGRLLFPLIFFAMAVAVAAVPSADSYDRLLLVAFFLGLAGSSAERNRLECPCHEGYFSVEDGRVLQGPPPRPLPMIRVEERDGNIVATGVGAHGEGA